MGDDGMDPCECLWNHELNMRRLISFLRQSQAYCTDVDCAEELPGLQGPESAGTSFMTMFLVMAFALAMYAMRPRRNRLEPSKPHIRNPHDDNGSPPAPPRI